MSKGIAIRSISEFGFGVAEVVELFLGYRFVFFAVLGLIVDCWFEGRWGFVF